jgi:hypothetical protein
MAAANVETEEDIAQVVEALHQEEQSLANGAENFQVRW